MPKEVRRPIPKLALVMDVNKERQIVTVKAFQRQARPGSRTRLVGSKTFKGGTETDRIVNASDFKFIHYSIFLKKL